MGIEVQVEVKGDYIHVRCRGAYGLEALLGAFRRAIDAASHEGLRDVLVDLRDLEGNPPSTMERFEVGRYVAEIGRGHRLAVVVNPRMADPERLGETVALNRGATGRLFTDADEAVAWLMRAGVGGDQPRSTKLERNGGETDRCEGE